MPDRREVTACDRTSRAPIHRRPFIRREDIGPPPEPYSNEAIEKMFADAVQFVRATALANRLGVEGPEMPEIPPRGQLRNSNADDREAA